MELGLRFGTATRMTRRVELERMPLPCIQARGPGCEPTVNVGNCTGLGNEVARVKASHGCCSRIDSYRFEHAQRAAHDKLACETARERVADIRRIYDMYKQQVNFEHESALKTRHLPVLRLLVEQRANVMSVNIERATRALCALELRTHTSEPRLHTRTRTLHRLHECFLQRIIFTRRNKRPAVGELARVSRTVSSP